MIDGPRSPIRALLAAVALTAMPAWAQDDPVPAESVPGDVEAIEIIGERIDVTDVQDEAQAITAFSAEDLDRANIQNIDTLAFNVPGLHVGQSGQQAIVTLRGVGTENASITGEPGVAFHVDGINFAQPSAARVAFFDLESLDVKRGPQGLLGGKNSTSGSINLVTRKPGDEYEVSGDVLFGNYDRVRARGAVNLPLGELAATRFAFFHEDRDGFLDNRLAGDSRDPFDADDFGLRSHLRFTPTDSIDILLSWNYFKQTGNGPQGDLAAIPKTVNCNPSGFPSQSIVGLATVMPQLYACNFAVTQAQFDPGPPPRIIPATAEYAPSTEDRDPRSLYSDSRSAQSNRFWGWRSSIDWDVPALPLLGETRLKALGGFQKTDTEFRQDFDGTDLVLTQIESARAAEQYTSELQWSGAAFDERVRWQASGYFSRERGFDQTEIPSLSNDNALQILEVSIDQETENKSYGAALHTSVQLADTVRFELGGRWIKDSKRVKLFRDARGGGGSQSRFAGCDGLLGITQFGQPREEPEWCGRTYRGTTWGSSIDWRPFDGDHLLYAKIDRGFKSGGFRSGRVGEYLPERIWAYAAGTKSEFFDSRLRINIEGFFYAYQDMQLVVIDGFSLRTENADTRMYGWDLELQASPIPGLNLGAVLSFLETETLDYFTLDPAGTELAIGSSANATIDQVRAFNQRRLNERDLADDLADRGFSSSYESRRCFASPELVRLGTNTLCGEVTPFGGLDDFSGNQLSRAPQWKVTLSAEYEIPLGPWGTLTPRVQYLWQDDTYYRAFNRDFDLQEAHHLTDAKLIWRSPEGRWEAEVFVTNIEDEAPKQNILVGPRFFGAPPLSWYGAPRFFGARLGFRY